MPKEYHAYVRTFDFTVLDIDRKVEDRIIPEIMALEEYEPHVIVDDLSYTTAFSSRFLGIPRISIVRKGILPFESNIPGYEHS